MELLILFVVILLVNLVFSVWLLANHRVFRDRIGKLEKNVSRLAAVVSDVADADVSQDDTSVKGLVSQATPEDIEQAMQILASFGLDKD